LSTDYVGIGFSSVWILSRGVIVGVELFLPSCQCDLSFKESEGINWDTWDEY